MAYFIPQDLYGIIGWPLSQTLSPLIHNTAFQILGIPSVYLAWPLERHDLEKFVNSMRFLNIRGCSVTIPHKIEIIQFLDEIDPNAELAGAVNTLYWHEGKLHGENTDVSGFLAPLNKESTEKSSILILGAGGAAHAVAAGLKLWNCKTVYICSPGNRHQYELAEKSGFMPIRWEDRYELPASLIINSTPLGMMGKYVNENPYDFKKARKVENGIAYDLVYNPLETLFLKDAAENDRRTISGVEMFLSQANSQFFLWTGRNLPDSIRQCVLGRLNS